MAVRTEHPTVTDVLDRALAGDRIDDADAAVQRIRAKASGMADIEYVGPLPVFSFLDDLSSGPEPEPRSNWGW